MAGAALSEAPISQRCGRPIISRGVASAGYPSKGRPLGGRFAHPIESGADDTGQVCRTSLEALTGRSQPHIRTSSAAGLNCSPILPTFAFLRTVASSDDLGVSRKVLKKGNLKLNQTCRLRKVSSRLKVRSAQRPVCDRCLQLSDRVGCTTDCGLERL